MISIHPLYVRRILNRRSRIFLKLENLQPSGSFKSRYASPPPSSSYSLLTMLQRNRQLHPPSPRRAPPRLYTPHLRLQRRQRRSGRRPLRARPGPELHRGRAHRHIALDGIQTQSCRRLRRDLPRRRVARRRHLPTRTRYALRTFPSLPASHSPTHPLTSLLTPRSSTKAPQSTRPPSTTQTSGPATAQ